jgi:uncharacterized protein (TIGR03083 family)
MHTLDILHYGQTFVLDAAADLSEAAWAAPGACGSWSAKDVLAHLTAYEFLLRDVLRSVLGDEPTPYLDHMAQPDTDFNEAQVAARLDRSPAELLEEFNAAHAEVMALARRIAPDVLSAAGTLPWYGPDYALEDFIVYANYGHKREHGGQIAAMRTRLAT